MDARTLRVLEYDAVRQRLSGYASSSLGKELAEQIEPTTAPEEVRRLIADRLLTVVVSQGGGKLLGLPIPIYIMVAIALLSHVLLKYTVYGRQVIAVGANDVTARLSGVKSDRIKMIAYALSASTATIAGMRWAIEQGYDQLQPIAGPLKSYTATVTSCCQFSHRLFYGGRVSL